MSLPIAPVTGWSSFWSQSAPSGQGAPYAFYGNRTGLERRIDMLLGKKGFRQYRRVMRTLLGAAVGQSAVETNYRIRGYIGADYTSPPPSTFSGNIVIESQSIINRNTTAADLTAMQAILDRTYNMAPAIASYPVDLGGNGGGGKLGR